MSLSLSRTVKDLLVEHLRDDIIRGAYAPGGYLRLEDVAARFEVSTMPVREALRDLEAEGLVTIFPRRGATVTELTADELEDIYDIRATLEGMATRLAVAQMTEDTFEELDRIVEHMDGEFGHVARLVQLNHLFHCTLYAASHRRHLCDLNRMLRYRTQHYLHAYIEDSGSMALAQEQHRRILDACRQGDAEKAASLVEGHVTEVGQALIEYVRLRDGDAEP